jgi:hypothetical protein
MCMRGGYGADDGAIRCRRVRDRALVRRRGLNGGQPGCCLPVEWFWRCIRERPCQGRLLVLRNSRLREPVTTTRPRALAVRDLVNEAERNRETAPTFTMLLWAMAFPRQLQPLHRQTQPKIQTKHGEQTTTALQGEVR